MPLNFLYHPAFKGRLLKLNQQAQRIFIFVRMSSVWHLPVRLRRYCCCWRWCCCRGFTIFSSCFRLLVSLLTHLHTHARARAAHTIRLRFGCGRLVVALHIATDCESEFVYNLRVQTRRECMFVCFRVSSLLAHICHCHLSHTRPCVCMCDFLVLTLFMLLFACTAPYARSAAVLAQPEYLY